jgi:hypothetical protein
VIEFAVSMTTTKSPQALCDEVLDASSWKSFAGYGPIPGITQANMSDRSASWIGTRFSVQNSDGSRHAETVIEYVPGDRLSLRMDGFTPPLGKFATHFVERWRFVTAGTGTLVVRSFELHPRHWAGNIPLWLVSIFLRKAVQIHLKALCTESS